MNGCITEGRRKNLQGGASMATPRHVVALLIFCAVLGVASRADDSSFPISNIPFSFTRVGAEYRLSIGAYTYYYFAFDQTTDLLQPWTTRHMALGSPAATFGYTPGSGETRGFFRTAAIDVWSPRDTDRDGIDDLWELRNGLDPTNPADALFPNANNPGMTNLEYYRSHFGIERVTSFYSQEVSFYNHPFAISSEISVFNFPNITGASREAISPEVSIFNIPFPTGAAMEAISLEVSIFNVPFPTGAAKEAISLEVSVFNVPLATGPAMEAISPEVSVFNVPLATGAAKEAISPEITVHNAP